MGMVVGHEREKLFAQDIDKLTLAKAVELAESVRCARAGAATASVVLGQQTPVFKIVKQVNSAKTVGAGQVKCTVCGRNNHESSQCRFANYKCNKCNVKGHLCKMCNKVNYVLTGDVSEDDDVTSLSTAAEARIRLFSCRQDQVQCLNETCVTSPRECGEGEACVLPQFPNHGTYTIKDSLIPQPGQLYKSVLLSMTCHRRYGVIDSDGSVKTNGTNDILCVDGKWLPDTLPQCIRYCTLLPDASVRYMCRTPGSLSFRLSFRPCPRYVPHGTTVDPQCRTPLYYSHKNLLFMNCHHGLWDYIAKCEPDCGRVTPDGTGLVINGTSVKRGELPWHAGIYQKTDATYKQICGGTIVSNNVVISAAHCFWDDVVGKMPASQFAVAAGKIYRGWRSEHDKVSQDSEIKEIRIPDRFQGTGFTLQADLAALILVTPIVYELHVKPVCISFSQDFDRLQLQIGNLGKVAGWGLTGANGPSAEVLQVVRLPYVDYNKCFHTVPQTFQQFITLDKFCAGYTNGTTVCKGDSGGGLAFSTPDQESERYYLRGVVSAAPTDDSKECNDNSYPTFTRIADYGSFIKEAMQVKTLHAAPTDDSKECNDNSYPTFTRIADYGSFIKEAMQVKAVVPSSVSCTPSQFLCDDGDCVDQEADCNKVQKCVTGFEATCSSEETTTKKPIRWVFPPYKKETHGHLHETKDGDTSKKDLKPIIRLKREELPWHVGIYDDLRPTPICGGSIISPLAVISAATCYRRQRYPPRLLLASAGQMYRKINDSRNLVNDSGVQYSLVHALYTVNKYPEPNIAVLTLFKEFKYNDHIQPVTLIYDSDLESLTTRSAKLAGWDPDTRELVSNDLPYIRTEDCRHTLTSELRNTLNGGICTGYFGPLQRALSFEGGGLVYREVTAGTARYYLRGVMAAAESCSGEPNSCAFNFDSYIIFTEISPYEKFLKKFIDYVDYKELFYL